MDAYLVWIPCIASVVRVCPFAVTDLEFIMIIRMHEHRILFTLVISMECPDKCLG